MFPLSVIIRNWLLEPVLLELKEIKTKMATDKAALDAVIQPLGVLITNDDAIITQLLTLVQSIIGKVGGTVDLSTEITALQSISATATNQQTELNTAITNLKSAGA